MTTALPRAVRRSRFGFDWLARFCLEQSDQALAAITGETATFTRNAASGGNDAAGGIFAHAYAQPAFDWEDLNADGVRETAGLFLDGNSSLYFAYNATPALRTLWIDVTDFLATGANNGTRIIEVGNSGSAGAYLTIRRAAGGYDAVHYNGSATVTATVTCTVVAGDHIRLRVSFAANGSVTLAVTQNASAEVVGSATAANAPAAVWNAARVTFGAAYGGTSNSGTFFVVRDIPGAQTAAFMQAG